MTWRIILRPWCRWRGHDDKWLLCEDRILCFRCHALVEPIPLDPWCQGFVDGLRDGSRLRAAGFYRYGKTVPAITHDDLVDEMIRLDRDAGMDRSNSCGKTRTELLYPMADPRVLTGMKPNRPPAEGGER